MKLTVMTLQTENGKKSGEEFIRECVIPYALNKTDNDLDSIMSAYGAKIVKEKTGILSRLFRQLNSKYQKILLTY